MPNVTENQAAQSLKRLFIEGLSTDEAKLDVDFIDEPVGDLLIESPAGQFLIELKGSNNLPVITNAIRQIQAARESDRDSVIPVLVVPYMTDSGKQRCQEAGISWADLSGNADIKAPNLIIHIEGKPNQFKRRGRPSDLFEGKSSRIVRHLLMNPNEWFKQRALVEATGLSEGYTSQVIKGLEADSLILRKKQGRTSKVKVRDPDLMLDTWRDSYDFEDHDIEKGLVPGRSGAERLQKIARHLKSTEHQYAATGLCGAWLLDEFADFRLTTFLIEGPLNPEIKNKIQYEKGATGANTWFVRPSDPSVFNKNSIIGEISVAHPIQIYLDLKGHPERAKEAAEHIRANKITWEEK